LIRRSADAIRRRMKRQPRLTKRERKALDPKRTAVPASAQHIHCIACGTHLDPGRFQAPATATMLRCKHGSQFASCTDCVAISQRLLEEHDRTGQNVQSAAAWH
jgi:hypothetical protein